MSMGVDGLREKVRDGLISTKFLSHEIEGVSMQDEVSLNVTEPYDERGKSPALQLYNHARELMDADRLDEAIAIFLKSATLFPHPKTYELIGECHARLRRFADAIPFFAAATTLNRHVRAPSLLAEAWFALGRHDEAIEAADIALARDPQNKKALKVRADATIEKERAERADNTQP